MSDDRVVFRILSNIYDGASLQNSKLLQARKEKENSLVKLF